MAVDMSRIAFGSKVPMFSKSCEVVRVERRSLYTWMLEEDTGMIYDVDITAGILSCSCLCQECRHIELVRLMCQHV